MRIIIGTESFAPNISGVTVMTESLARRLSSVGHDVCVFAPADNFSTRECIAFDGVKTWRFRSLPNPFRKGFRVSFLPRWQVARAVKEFVPDIIHLQDPASTCAALQRAGKRNNIPLVVTNHFSLDYVLSYLRYLRPLHPFISSMLRRYLVTFYNECDYVLCPTETVKKSLQSWGVLSPIEAISNGVDVQRFASYSSPSATRLKFNLPEGPIVLYVGRLDKDKCLETLFHAIPHVLNTVGNACFVFVGGGDETPKLVKMVERMRIGHAVRFLGWIPHDSEELPQLYQVGTVFVIPSIAETQSIVTLEALASGLPVVSVDAGALPELIQHGENGYLCPPGDSQSMAQCICRILMDDSLRWEMRRKCLETASRHHIDKSFARIEYVYEKVLRNSVQVCAR